MLKVFFIFSLTCCLAFNLSGQEYSFFIAGHVYGEQGVDNVGFHPPFKAKFPLIQNQEDIKFGVLLGDVVFYPSPEDWDEVDAEIDTLGIPVYIVPGNHDLQNRPLFEERYGITYSSFMYNNDLFILLDPLLNHWNISGEQFEFLQQTVLQNQINTENIFVMFHELLWYEEDNAYSYCGPNGFNQIADTINFWTEVIPFFEDLPNNVYMCAGDVGANLWVCNYMIDSYGFNITFFATGMGDGDGDNFMIINVDEDKVVTYEVIELEINEIEVDQVEEFVIWPNPIDRNLFIDVGEQTIISIEIFSIDGRKILSVNRESVNTAEVDVSCLPFGIYACVVSTTSKTYSRKFVKQ